MKMNLIKYEHSINFVANDNVACKLSRSVVKLMNSMFYLF